VLFDNRIYKERPVQQAAIVDRTSRQGRITTAENTKGRGVYLSAGGGTNFEYCKLEVKDV
jgi:hypothetical protein